MATLQVNIFKYTKNIWRNLMHGINGRLILVQNFDIQLSENLSSTYLYVSFNFNILKASFNFDILTGV